MRKKGLSRRALSLGLAFLIAGTVFPASVAPASPALPGFPETPRQVAIVIDDFGNRMKGTEQMLELPVRLTVAVMPFLPTTRRDAEEAHAKGHDVIVHMPMEPVRGNPKWLGPNAILTSLSDGEIRERVEKAIADVPHAVGMNNHMGSRATADERVMRIVLQVCKEKGLFFLDSRTSHRSVVSKVAAELGVPTIRNDVFLDDVYSARHVARQLDVVLEKLEKDEKCVVIGHVGPPGLITSDALKSAIPQLQKKVMFVTLSQLGPDLVRKAAG
ncbi:divergent polysaccharide deacetylase family protein [Cohnella massiliensis]|uniref:divergent polysaccharide deacetylase family protein n=1 Tax=Cohnella massiliensis TaxID=1816691 RepID=UPI001FE77123|nr:divergent polysaccharide deacetylase family protein [Cohnella massiliensis]